MSSSRNTARTWACAQPPTSIFSLQNADHEPVGNRGPLWHSRRLVSPDLVCVPQLECAAARADCGAHGRLLFARAAAFARDRNVHGRRLGLPRAVFSDFPARRIVGKLMEDSASFSSIADYITEKLGPKRAILAVVLGGAFVTYGGQHPRRLMPAAIMLGTSPFTMSAMPGTPSIQNTIPMPFFGTTPFAAPGLGILASIITLAFGLWWLAPRRDCRTRPRRKRWRRRAQASERNRHRHQIQSTHH